MTEKISIYGFDALLTRRPVKNLRLTVKNGVLQISAPRFMPLAAIEDFVAQKADWITKHLAKSKSSDFNYINGEALRVWGTEYNLIVRMGARSGAKFCDDGVIEMRVREGADRKERERVFFEFLRKETHRAASVLMPYWENITGLNCGGFSVRNMTSRWGSCKIGEGKISLSLHLAKFPPECLDYIIVHELAHIIIPNHGEAFKAFMDKYYPDWRQVRKLLKNG